ncbi:hypothetical protein [Streptomyces aureus]|uniref:hypothetical protein n=1 Tax=Streptomyces aureus TaxID=193461 RepID=UPI0036AFC15E
MTVIAAAAAAWAVAISPAAAVTTEKDVTSSDNGTHQYSACRVASYGQACFAPDGEWFSVEDDQADSKSVVVIWELYGKDLAGHYTDLLRRGYIWHTMGNGTIGYQNKSFPENLRVSFLVCRGKYAEGTCTDGTSWVTTAT